MASRRQSSQVSTRSADSAGDPWMSRVQWGVNVAPAPANDPDWNFRELSALEQILAARFSRRSAIGSLVTDNPTSDTAQSNTAQSNTAQSNTAQSNTAQSNTAQSNTAQSNTAQSNTAQSNSAHWSSDELDRLDKQLASERAKLLSLEHELERETQANEDASDCDATFLELERECSRLRQAVQTARSQAEHLERTLVDYRSQLRSLLDAQSTNVEDNRLVKRLVGRLDHLDRRIRRWREEQRRGSDQLIRLREQLVGGQLVGGQLVSGPSSRSNLDEIRRVLFSFEHSAEQLLESVDDASRGSRSSAGIHVQIEDFKTHLADAYAGLHQLHHELSSSVVDHEKDRVRWHLRSVRRRARDIRRSLAVLMDKRHRLLSALAKHGVTAQWLSQRAQSGHCACDAETVKRDPCHSNRSGALPVTVEGARSAGSGDQHETEVRCEALRLHIDRLEKSRRAWLAQAEDAQGRQFDLERRQRQAMSDARRFTRVDGDSLHERIRQVQSRIRHLAIARQECVNRAASRVDRRGKPSQDLLATASQILGRLSDNSRTQIDWETIGRSFQVRESHDDWVAIDSLPSNTQVLVLVSLCIALLGEDRPTKSVLVWESPLDRLTFRQSVSVIRQLIRECPSRSAIVVTTEHRELAQRLHDKEGCFLAHADLEPPFVPRKGDTETPVDDGRKRSIVHRRNNSDSEEFPGEFRDQLVADSTDSDLGLPILIEDSIEAYESAASARSTDRIDWQLNQSNNQVNHELRITPAFEFSAEQGDADINATPPPYAESEEAEYDWSDEESLGDELSEPVNRERNADPIMSVDQHTRLRDLGLIDEASLQQLESIGVVLVRDLQGRSPESIMASCPHPRFSIRQVETWRHHATLRCKINRLSRFDADVLVACGVDSVDRLRQWEGYELADRIANLRTSAAGQELLRRGTDEELANLNAWELRMRESRRLHRFGYHDSSSDLHSTQSTNIRRSQAPQAAAKNPAATHRPKAVRPKHESEGQDTIAFVKPKASQQKNDERKLETLRFYLDLDDEVEAAPSIGPKMAEHLEAVDVITIRDLLAKDAQEISTRMNHNRAKTATVDAWQKQAEFVCRVPNLRGHDAQLLVACGIETVETLAASTPEGLFAIVGPFSETREGAKILRAGKRPDLEEVTSWIRWAQHQRPLLAA